MEATRTGRLGRHDWFRAGLEMLAEAGPGELKAVKLARRLGVTTGSFYWHFESAGDFREQLPGYWRDHVVGPLVRETRADPREGPQLLVGLRRRILDSPAHRYDAAMREWARCDRRVQEAVAAADGLRGRCVKEVLVKCGLSEADARDRVELIGAAWRGSLERVDDPESRMKLMGLAASTSSD